MKNKHLLKLFDCLTFAQQNLLFSESKKVYRSGLASSAEKLSAKEKKNIKDKIKEQQKELKENNNNHEKFNKQLDKFLLKKRTFEFKGKFDAKIFTRQVLANSVPGTIKKNRELKKFIPVIYRNLKFALESHGIDKLPTPLRVTVNPGGVIDIADKKDKRLATIDLKKDSFYTAKLEQYKQKISKLRSRLEGKKQKVHQKTRESHTGLSRTMDLSAKFGNLHEAIKESKKLKGKVKVVKVGPYYQIKFLGRSKAERRKNELALKIEDIFNVGLLNRYRESVLRIQVINPRRGTYTAKYYPERGSFYIDDNPDKRAKIFEGGKIKVLEFKVVRNRPQAPKGSAKLSTVNPAKSKAAIEKAQKEAKEQREFERDQRKDYLFNKYYNFIFKKERFGGHKLLQSNEDFKNWARVSHVLGPILARPPFNMRNASDQKRYMQLVIQGTGFWDPNWEIQGKDFFKYGISYKGGYEKFIKDYKKLTKKFDNKTISDEEMEKLTILEDIAIGIARVYEALQKMKPLKAEQESEKEKLDRTTLLNVPRANATELKEVRANRYLNYPLANLNHSKEKSSYQVNILVASFFASGLALGLVAWVDSISPFSDMDCPIPFRHNRNKPIKNTW